MVEVRSVMRELGQIALREMVIPGVKRLQVAIEKLAGH
jgi:hypothetical protein